jgi:hypothetical protein
VHAHGGAEGDVRSRLSIKPLAFATYFPAALALTGLPRQEVFEIEVIVVAAAIDASTFHAQGSGVEPVLFASPRLFSGKR